MSLVSAACDVQLHVWGPAGDHRFSHNRTRRAVPICNARCVPLPANTLDFSVFIRCWN